MEDNNGDKIILQIVPPIAENVLEYFEGEIVIKWKNLLLKRLEDQDICIWQQTDFTGGKTEIDPSLFLPQVDAIVVFYEIKNKASLVNWLKAIISDIRLKNVKPIVVGCYQKGENTKEFIEQFLTDGKKKEHFFLWRIDTKTNEKTTNSRSNKANSTKISTSTRIRNSDINNDNDNEDREYEKREGEEEVEEETEEKEEENKSQNKSKSKSKSKVSIVSNDIDISNSTNCIDEDIFTIYQRILNLI